jgi:hypothetical protein
MAGLTADERSDRIEYDTDGTVVWYSTGTFGLADPPVLTMSNANMRQLNDDNNQNDVLSGGGNSVHIVCFQFTAPMTLTGYQMGLHAQGVGAAIVLQYSLDSTNGSNGTFTNTGWTTQNSTNPFDIKNNKLATSLTNVTWLRLYMQTGGSSSPATYIRNMNLYGYPTAGLPTQRLEFWQPVTNAEASPALFDYAEIPQSSTNTKQFRVKNMHSTLTANSIVVTAADVMKDAAVALGSQIQVSTDNVTFTSTVNIGNLAAGAISPILYHRWNPAANATLSMWSARVSAVAGSWT